MAILRNTVDTDNPISYVATLAFFCCVSCVVIMLKFRGFRARIDFASKYAKDENVPVVCISGAYRTNREEFFESGSIVEPPKKITPSMVILPPNNNSSSAIKPSKSTSDVREPDFLPVAVSKSTPEISFDPRGGKNNIPEVELKRPEKNRKESKKEEKEKLKLEKKRQAELKAREKAVQEQTKLEKAKREKEQKAAEAQAKQEKAKREKELAKQAKERNKKGGKNKAAAPPAPPLPQSAQPQTSSAPTPPIRQNRQPLSPTSTLQSDINRSSGPPPYSETPPEPVKKMPSQPSDAGAANTSNVSFGKPIDNSVSSWDMVSQHRQQMSRPTATSGGGARRQVVMDLQYNFNKAKDDRDNSDA